jgi:hypothetical protein
MKSGKQIIPRLFGWLIVMAAVLAVGIAAFVYTGPEHREAAKGLAREFFLRVEKASRVKRVPVSVLTSPTPEGGTIP